MTTPKRFEDWLKNEPNKNKLPESRFEWYAAKFGLLVTNTGKIFTTRRVNCE